LSQQEISSKLGWGGARANSGGPRANSGGRRPGAGRKPASRDLATARIAASIASIRTEAQGGARWYCAEVIQRMELLALEALAMMGFPAFAPRILRETASASPAIVPMFPGYILVRADIQADPWWQINHLPGIKGLLGAGSGLPTPARPGVIESLAAQVAETADGVTRREALPQRPVITEGATVRVTDGPLASFVGIVKWTAGRRVGVLVDLFGQATSNPIDLSVTQVETV